METNSCDTESDDETYEDFEEAERKNPILNYVIKKNFYDILKKSIKSSVKTTKETKEEPDEEIEETGSNDEDSKILNVQDKILLDQHEKLLGPYPYVCRICKRGFKSKSPLQSHMNLKHKKGEQYNCESCPKKFKNKGTLYRHSLTHQHSTIYQCHYCQKCFNNENNLVKHRQSYCKTKT